MDAENAVALVGSFPSKVDLWFLLVFWGVAAACFVGAPFVKKRSLGAAVLVAAIGLLFVGVGFNARALRYEVRADGDVVTAGSVVPSGELLFRVADVIEVVPSHDGRSAPASSLDRLRVTHARGVVLVSPDDKVGFMAALAKVRPALVRDGDGLRVAGE